MILIDNSLDAPPDHYGRALAAYKRHGVPNAEMGAAFFAAMSESLEILMEEVEQSWPKSG